VRKQNVIGKVAELLVSAAYGRTASTDEPWDYGWSIESYRRSGTAAIRSDRGEIVSFSPDGVGSVEQGVSVFLSLQDVRRLYDESDVWVLATSLCASVPTASGREERVRELLADRLLQLIDPPESTVVLPIANTSSAQTPVKLAGLTIGMSADPVFQPLREQIEAGVGKHRMRPWWLNPSENALVLAYTGPEQMGKAVRMAERRFEDVVATALMFEEDLEGRNLFSLRGDSHRPGIRGLAVDRQYLVDLAKDIPSISRELGAPVVATSRFGTRLSSPFRKYDYVLIESRVYCSISVCRGRARTPSS
jgi:hypothetical protein